MKKKYLALILAALLLPVLSGMLTVQAEEDGAVTLSELESDGDFTSGISVFKKDQNIEETVLYDEGGVKIIATGINYANYEAELCVRIENNSDRNLEFLAETYGYSRNAVNGFMIENGYIGLELAPGESGEDSAGFGYNELLLHGISEIADIQIGFSISDDDNNRIYTGPMQVKTPLAESYEYANDGYQKAISSKAMQYTYGYKVQAFAAKEAFNSGGIRILSECYMENEDGEHSLMLEVINDNDFVAHFTTRDIQMNGTLVYDSSWSYEVINPHCRTLVNIQPEDILDEDEMAEYGIEEIESIGFTVNVANDDGIVVAEPKEVVINL